MALNAIEILFCAFCVIYILSSIKKVSLENFKELSESNGIDLKNIKVMTFFKDEFTTANRTTPIKQLNCVSGNACNKSYYVKSVQCTNEGQNENDETQWKCNTSLPKNLNLGKTNVNCEGLKNNTDKIKLKGSCGLEYSLDDSHTSENEYDFINNIYLMCIFVILFLFIILFLIKISPLIHYPTYNYYPYHLPYYKPYYGTMYVSSPSYSSYGNNASSFLSSTGYGTTTTR